MEYCCSKGCSNNSSQGRGVYIPLNSNFKNIKLWICNPCLQELLHLSYKEEVSLEYGNQVMPKVKGQPFRCSCGCNIFTQQSKTTFKCNSCSTLYSSE